MTTPDADPTAERDRGQLIIPKRRSMLYVGDELDDQIEVFAKTRKTRSGGCSGTASCRAEEHLPHVRVPRLRGRENTSEGDGASSNKHLDQIDVDQPSNPRPTHLVASITLLVPLLVIGSAGFARRPCALTC
ncbi:hypothetical protein [Streptomyces sp. 5-6(2022)]|uniref:hypothetical protein n=1 Tax=Streptomyces sp. 5-6(2022) TaxID=2936510 RepID=UPI0023B9B23A|nr:hypothetical protein [Streptomyces sp. 5-6(2022)]